MKYPLKDIKGEEEVDVTLIIHIDALGSYVLVFIFGRKDAIKLSRNLKYHERKLKGAGLWRAGRGALINPTRIIRKNRNHTVIMQDDAEILLNPSFDEALEALTKAA
jgi:DNA-binding LytR/AlgR family response regulator